MPTKSWKNHPQKLLRKTQIHFFSLLPAQPKRPKQKTSCSKMWLIDQLYIELGLNWYCALDWSCILTLSTAFVVSFLLLNKRLLTALTWITIFLSIYKTNHRGNFVPNYFLHVESQRILKLEQWQNYFFPVQWPNC